MQRFGIHYVDYDNNLARYPKDSAKWYSQLIANTTGNPRRLAREQAEQRLADVDGVDGVASVDMHKMRRSRHSQTTAEL